MRNFVHLAVSLSALSCLGVSLVAQVPMLPQHPKPTREGMMKAHGERRESAQALEGAFRWLKRRQVATGEVKDKRGADSPFGGVGNTALAALVFVSDGSTLERGPHEDALKKALKFLAKQQDGHGRFADGDESAERAREPLLTHALATLAVYEVGLLSADNRYLQTAMRGIEFSKKVRLQGGQWPAVSGDKNGDVPTTLWMLHSFGGGLPTLLFGGKDQIEPSRAWLEEGRALDVPGTEARIWNAGSAFLLLYTGRAGREDEAQIIAARLVGAAVPKWGGAPTLTHLYFGGNLLAQTEGEPWEKWRLGVMVEAREWLDDPPKGATVERVAAAALALGAYYRFPRLGL